MHVSHHLVVLVAAVVWCGGGVLLVLKGGALLGEAHDLRPEGLGPAAALLCGLTAGALKGVLIFARSCRKNLARIGALESPRIWQCFRPGFLIFLAIIIPTGAMLSRLVSGHYTALLVVAALDLSIATALLLSSVAFWRDRALSNR